MIKVFFITSKDLWWFNINNLLRLIKDYWLFCGSEAVFSYRNITAFWSLIHNLHVPVMHQSPHPPSNSPPHIRGIAGDNNFSSITAVWLGSAESHSPALYNKKIHGDINICVAPLSHPRRWVGKWLQMTGSLVVNVSPPLMEENIMSPIFPVVVVQMTGV